MPMIKIGGVEPSAIMVGDAAVYAVYRGTELVWEGVKKYGGIKCRIDNAAYSSGNVTLDRVTKKQ